jgi:anti-sigma B factor antagonist
MAPHANRFAVRTAEAGSGVPRVSVQGEIDMATAGAVRAGALRQIELHGPTLVLDLSRTSFMDSSGLHLIEELRDRTCGNGGGLALVVATKGVRRLLEIAPPPSDVQVVGTDAQAEAAFGRRVPDDSRMAAA